MTRKRASNFEALINLASRLPWWAGVALAVASYLVLGRLAVPASAPAFQPGQMGATITRSAFTGLATAGQYLLPIVFSAGAALSFWRRRHRASLITDVRQAKGVQALNGMSWREFELLVGEAFRLQGYRVIEPGSGGADGGVDLILRSGSEKFLVQCKHWRASKVSVMVVRELYGVMAAEGAAGGFVVSSGTFTEDAARFADGGKVTLIGGQRLFDLITQARQSLDTKAPARAEPRHASQASAPTCPVCASAMLMRIAKKGPNPGSQFWGCPRFPSCSGKRPAD